MYYNGRLFVCFLFLIYLQWLKINNSCTTIGLKITNAPTYIHVEGFPRGTKGTPQIYFFQHLLKCNDKNTQFSINFATCVFLFLFFWSEFSSLGKSFAKKNVFKQKIHGFEVFFIVLVIFQNKTNEINTNFCNRKI